MNLLNLLYPLFLTLLIETPIYFEFGNKRSVKTLLCLTLLNIVSNLLFNLIYIALDYSYVFLIMGEMIVTFIEGAFLYLIFNSIRNNICPYLFHSLFIARENDIFFRYLQINFYIFVGCDRFLG